MEYYGKNLPKGFFYVLTKKELLEINSQFEKSIKAVKLDGTSYSESKLAISSLSKHSLWIYSYLEEAGVYFTLTQFGVKKSNFRNNEELLIAKNILIDKIIKVIQGKKEDYIENKFISDTTYLYLEGSAAERKV